MSPSVKPFNEAKYKALMDGLECSEIRFNEIHNWNPIFRIDAEFYNKRAITIDTQIRKMSHLCLNKEDVVSGPFGSTLKSASYLSEGPVPFIRIENIKGGFYVNTLNIMYISEKDNNRIKNSALRVDDIVLSKVGNSIGYFARIDKRIPYCNISENNIGIKLEKYQESFKHYLVEALYREGRKMIMENYPEYYFWDFYRANEDFEYTYRDVPPDKSECLIVGMKMNRNRGTKWSFVITGFVRLFGKHYGVEYNENVQFACNISDVLSQSTDYISKHPKTSEQDYLSWILREINSEVSHSIIQAFKEHYEHTTYASRQLTKIQSLEKRALSIIWSIFTLNAKDDSNKTYDEMIRSRNSYEVIRQNPLNYFEYHMEVDLQPNRVLTASEESWYKKLYETRNQNSVIWFLSFVYRLRNALFHEIIDPLNEEWQLIFKNAYLVLKEIVDLNISEIGKTAIAENSVV